MSVPGKPALRAMLRARRDAFLLDDPARRIPCPPELAGMIASATLVAAYVPLGSEADPMPLVEGAGALALPVVTTRADPIRFARWSPGDPLVAGPFGLRQPSAQAPDAAPDLILAPLLGFDRAFNRLGQGAGHYDRAFAAHPHALRIGVAWSVQETDMLPTDPWDLPLHALVTEGEWIVR